MRDKRSTYTSAVAHPLGVGESQHKSKLRHPHPGRCPVPTHSTNKRRSHTSEICSTLRCAWCYSNVFKGHSIRDPPHQTVHYVLRCWVGRAGTPSPTDTCCCYRVATAAIADHVHLTLPASGFLQAQSKVMYSDILSISSDPPNPTTLVVYTL